MDEIYSAVPLKEEENYMPIRGCMAFPWDVHHAYLFLNLKGIFYVLIDKIACAVTTSFCK